MSRDDEMNSSQGSGEQRISHVPKNPSYGPGSDSRSFGADGIEFLLDIPLELRVEVGRTTMTMGELVRAQEGTVIELNRPSGDSLDIMANGKLVARGEAVLVGDRYGVRILEVIGAGNGTGEGTF